MRSRLPLTLPTLPPFANATTIFSKLHACPAPLGPYVGCILTDFRVTCGLYINIILNDYVGTLVGIPELNTAWFLNPYVGGGTEPIAAQATPIATGNQVSCEFNLVYRFHMIISERDDKWTQALFAKLFPGKDPATISLDDFRAGLTGHLAAIDPDPSKRGVAGLTRKPDGSFDDAELIQIITESTEDMAGIYPPHVLGFTLISTPNTKSPFLGHDIDF